MPSLPIPVFVAIVLGFAGVRLWQDRGRPEPLVLLLLLCAMQSLIIALNQHYGIAMIRPVQPVVASLIPPLAWHAFQANRGLPDLVHLLGPMTALAAIFVAPAFLDAFLPGMFALYGVMILGTARKGADVQPDARLSSGDLPVRIWQVIAAALIASALSDVLIVGAHMAGYPALRPWIISIFSVGNLALIGALGLSPHLQRMDDTPQTTAPPQSAQLVDPEIWEHLTRYMESHKPYLDPDLTLMRLARKLGVPAKALSATINQTTGDNVSRYINAARIKVAVQEIEAGTPVTSAMLMAGFHTKSNFNREFLRVQGMSPSAWIKSNAKTSEPLEATP